MTGVRPILAVLGLALVAVHAQPLAAQTADYPHLEKDEEIRLALSAGPPSVSSHADVYVMAESGFERVIEGTNGWACIVVRAAANRTNLAPHCLNPEAVAGVLPAFLHEARLQARGMDAEVIEQEMKEAWTSGDLPLPEGPAFAYMLSKGQRLGANASSFLPHFMLYKPYVTNADIGGDPTQMQFPFVGPYENHPLSTVVVIMDEFVDPDEINIPGR